jgi:hypothetical protein
MPLESSTYPPKRVVGIMCQKTPRAMSPQLQHCMLQQGQVAWLVANVIENPIYKSWLAGHIT